MSSAFYKGSTKNLWKMGMMNFKIASFDWIFHELFKNILVF